MKSIKNFINEAYWDEYDDFEMKEAITNWIKHQYMSSEGDLTLTKGKDGKYIVDVSEDLVARPGLETITNGMFEFGNCEGNVILSNTLIKSLEGSPQIVEYTFDCSGCKKLKKLNNGPKLIKGDFKCNGCGGRFHPKDVVMAKIDVKGNTLT